MLELRIRADKSGDRLPDKTWPVSGVEMVNEPPGEHNFSDDFVVRSLEQGILEFTKPRPAMTNLMIKGEPVRYERNPVITGDEIVLKTQNRGDVRYKIVEHPGVYEDEGEAHGYRVTHEYKTRLVKASTKKD